MQTEKKYDICYEGTYSGPYSFQEITKLFGEVPNRAELLYFCEHRKQWFPIDQLEESDEEAHPCST